jgi:hypothetical protein
MVVEDSTIDYAEMFLEAEAKQDELDALEEQY